MKKETIEYFCDRCDAKLEAEPRRVHDVQVHLEPRITGGSGVVTSASVTVEYYHRNVVAYGESMLCDKCKIDILQSLIDELTFGISRLNAPADCVGKDTNVRTKESEGEDE